MRVAGTSSRYIISDMGKARRYGFNACVDSEDMFLRLFTQFREQRIIP
jgi:hypothetical protein